MTDDADALTAAAIEAGCTLHALQEDIRVSRAMTPDDLPASRSVLGGALVEIAGMAMEIVRLQGELEDERRITASLARMVEDLGQALEVRAA